MMAATQRGRNGNSGLSPARRRGADVRGVWHPPRRRSSVLSFVRHLCRLGRSPRPPSPTGPPTATAPAPPAASAPAPPTDLRAALDAGHALAVQQDRPDLARHLDGTGGAARCATGPRRRRRGVQAGQEHVGQCAAADAGLPGRRGRRHRRPDAGAVRRHDRGPRPSRPTRGSAPAGTVGAGRRRLGIGPRPGRARVGGGPDAPSHAAVWAVPARHSRRRRARLGSWCRHPRAPSISARGSCSSPTRRRSSRRRSSSS